MARILIADDDPDYRAVFCDGLETLGHSVTAVPTGAEVVPRLRRQRFDIVFLDVMMAGGGAISVLHKVREFHDSLPTVIITGRSDLVDSPLYTKGMRSADAKLQKTASLADLDRVVRVLTQG